MVINSVDFEQQSFFGRRTADGRRRTACNVDLLFRECLSSSHGLNAFRCVRRNAWDSSTLSVSAEWLHHSPDHSAVSALTRVPDAIYANRAGDGVWVYPILLMLHGRRKQAR